jgi:ferredoxin
VAYNVNVDRDLCIGSGNCTRITRGAFKLDDEDKAVFDPAADVTDEDLEEAEGSCPTGAIELRPGGAAA